MSDFDSKVILVGLKSDLKNDEETKKKLAEKEKVKVNQSRISSTSSASPPSTVGLWWTLFKQDLTSVLDRCLVIQS